MGTALVELVRCGLLSLCSWHMSCLIMPTTLLELLLLLSSQCYIHVQEFFFVLKETQIAKFQQAPLCRICEPPILPGDKLFCEDICGFFGDDFLLLCPTRSTIITEKINAKSK
jgi:hypothetical protein